MVDYKESGVDIELGDDASKILYNAAKQTWENRKGRLGELVVPFDDFSGVRAIDVSGLPEGTLMNMGFDGVGTKMELAERINDHRTIAFDLFAMVCDDAVVRGAEPVLIGSLLDVNSLGKDEETYIEQVKQLAEGYINAAKDANVAIVNGEIAELGSRVGGFGSSSFIHNLALQYISINLNEITCSSIRGMSAYLVEDNETKKVKIFEHLLPKEQEFLRQAEKLVTLNYNWGAAVTWFAKKDRMFTGYEVKPGDKLVGLKEEGFRSNGLSLVRRIMKDNYGENWHKFNGENQVSLAKLALEPSKIYSGAVVDMFGGYDGEPKAEVHGVAHITGGGIPSKLGRVLKPSGLGAIIDSPFNPSELMHLCQQIGDVPDEEAYITWCMGQGMIVITPESDKVQEVATQHGIESGVIGETTDTTDKIEIRSEGYYSRRQLLPFLDGKYVGN